MLNMAPCSADFDAADRRLGEAVIGRYVNLPISGCQPAPDLQDVGVADLGSPVRRASELPEHSRCVESISSARCVLKILQPRIALVAVQVVDLTPRGARPNERLANQVVNFRVPPFVASDQGDAPIPADSMPRALQDFAWMRSRRPRRSLDSAHGADGVVQLKTCDWGPEFAGQVGGHGVQRFTRHSSFPPRSIMAQSEA